MIEMNHVSKHFKVYRTVEESKRKLRSLLVREYDVKRAVDDICFTIDQGEMVGYVGPNGAGKSTTIKMLSGILTPTSGEINIDGIVPYKQRTKNALHIGVVFGQRSQLYWDLPMTDTFRLHQKMYEIEEDRFKKNVALFTEVLQMEKFLHQPVRQLSLGQKMRANIALALLHDPGIVYLDEPTIGLDIVAKARIRDCVKEINRLKNTTFLLTTHDMDDIESICSRLMLINHGKLGYDGTLTAFQQQYGDPYRLFVRISSDKPIIIPNLVAQANGEGSYTLLGSKSTLPIAEAIAMLTASYTVRDIRIEESSIESILKTLF